MKMKYTLIPGLSSQCALTVCWSVFGVLTLRLIAFFKPGWKPSEVLPACRELATGSCDQLMEEALQERWAIFPRQTDTLSDRAWTSEIREIFWGIPVSFGGRDDYKTPRQPMSVWTEDNVTWRTDRSLCTGADGGVKQLWTADRRLRY